MRLVATVRQTAEVGLTAGVRLVYGVRQTAGVSWVERLLVLLPAEFDGLSLKFNCLLELNL